MRPFFRSSALIFLSSAASYLILCLLVPAISEQNISQIRFCEYSIPYIGTFNIVSNIHQGQVTFWNFYDQMPLMYHIVNTGFSCSLIKGLIALVYEFSKRYFDSPAVAFHQVFTVSYIVLIILVQTTGVYLLIRRFSNSAPVVLFCLVTVNVMLSPHLFMGTGAGDIHVYLPFLIHWTLRLFERPSMNALGRLFLMWLVALYAIPFIAVQYVYQCVHVAALSCLAVYGKWIRPALVSAFNRPLVFFWGLGSRLWTRRTMFVALAVVAVLLMGPFIILLAGNIHDYTFGSAEKRFQNPFDFYEYFKRPVFFTPQKYFFCDMINFTMSERQFRQHWIARWLFTGFIPLFFAWMGLLICRDKRKYVFLISIAFFYLLNAPRNDPSLSGTAHWINALTNPLKFTTRSFHMAGAITLGYFLAPLMAMGLQSIVELIKSKRGLTERQVLGAAAGMLIVLLQVVFSEPAQNDFPQVLERYLIVNVFAIGIFLVMLWRWSRRAFLLPGVAVFLMIWGAHEAAAMGSYMRPVFNSFPVRSQVLEIKGSPEILPDYQNPEIYPFRYHFTAENIPKLTGYFETEPLNMYGLFARYTNMNKYFEEPEKWLPAHVSYGLLSRNKELQEYLARDSRLFYFASRMVEAKRGVLPRLVSAGLDREVVMAPVTQPDSQDPEAVLSVGKISYPPPRIDRRTIEYGPGDLNFVKTDHRRSLKIYGFVLPENFPKEMSSTVYTDDRNYLKVAMGQRELVQTQGVPLRPLSYDVQNFRTGELVVAANQDQPLTFPIRLSYPVSGIERVSKILVFKRDHLEFLYEAPADGWLVFHYPYDKKWKITIDDKPVDLFKANLCFIGFKIGKGVHQVSLRYWPGSLLRSWTAVSAVLVHGLFLTLVFVELGRPFL